MLLAMSPWLPAAWHKPFYHAHAISAGLLLIAAIALVWRQRKADAR
jgi:hypothetical protein